jgi:uracil phosphoribosyltransferase
LIHSLTCLEAVRAQLRLPVGHVVPTTRGPNKKGNIIPGLGDAGDRQFGTGRTD